MRITAALLGILLFMPGLGSAMGGKPKGDAITVAKEGGVWWFKDAEGKKFFSLGVDCIPQCFGHAEPNPLDPAVEKQTASWLASWGFNTAGSWSSPSIWKHAYVVDQIYSLYRHNESDVFDDNFWEPTFRNHVAKEVAAFPDKKRLIGYCLDNELSWETYEIYRIYLKKKADSPGRRELVSYTAKFYDNDIAKLNEDWGTKYSSFADLAEKDFPESYPDRLWKLMSAFRTHVAETYYRRYSGLVRELDPGRLILGVRWAGWAEKEVYIAVSRYFDVNTVNLYNRYGEMEDFLVELYENTGKPVLMTEYTFSGYPRPGKPSGLFCEVYSEENRALGYRKYVLGMARAPFMVGMHWFMWADYAVKEGQSPWASPDRTVGLVTSDGKKPYETLVAECARTNAEVAAAHSTSGSWKKPEYPAATAKDIPYFVPAVDGRLDEWPANCRVTPTLLSSLKEGRKFDQTFHLSQDGKYFYVGAIIADDSLDYSSDDKVWQGDFLHLLVLQNKDDDEWEIPSYYVFPTGCGKGKDQACSGTWRGKAPGEGWKTSMTGGKGKYSIEARLPMSALREMKPGATLSYRLEYNDVGGLLLTHWVGEGKLAPAPEKAGKK